MMYGSRERWLGSVRVTLWFGGLRNWKWGWMQFHGTRWLDIGPVEIAWGLDVVRS